MHHMGAPKWEVTNAGFVHYTSLHSLNRYLIDQQTADFDTVFLITGINDVLSFVHTGGLPGPGYSNFYRVPRRELNLGDTWPGRLPWLFGKLPSLRLYSYWSLSPFLPEHWDLPFISLDKDYASAENLERCYKNFHTRYLRQNLQSFIALCRLHKTPLVLFTNYYQRSDMKEPVRAFYAHGIDLVNDEIRRVAAEEDILLLDMDRELPPEAGMVDNKWQYTADGNRERVRIMSRFVQTHDSLAKPLRVPDTEAAQLR